MPDALLQIACTPGEARIYVDDAFVGRAVDLDGRTLKLKSGARRVEARADGYFTAHRDVALPANGREKLELALRPVPALERGE